MLVARRLGIVACRRRPRCAQQPFSTCGSSGPITPGFHPGDPDRFDAAAFAKGSYLEKEAAIAASQSYARTLYSRAMYEEGLRAAQLQERQCDAHFGRKHPATASALNNIALMHKMRGDHTRAIEAYTEALAAYRSALGTEEHPSFATALSNMALVYRALAEAADTPRLHRLAYHERAREAFERALQIREETLAPGHPDTEMARNNGALEAAEAAAAKGDKTAAEAALRLSVERLEESVGFAHGVTAAAVNNLGVFLKRQGRLAEAREQYERSRSVRLALLGPAHPDAIATTHNLAEVLEEMGEKDAATALRQEILKALGVPLEADDVGDPTGADGEGEGSLDGHAEAEAAAGGREATATRDTSYFGIDARALKRAVEEAGLVGSGGSGGNSGRGGGSSSSGQVEVVVAAQQPAYLTNRPRRKRTAPQGGES